MGKSNLWNAADIVGYTDENGAVYCKLCVKDKKMEKSAMTPIFAASEWDYQISCWDCSEDLECLTILQPKTDDKAKQIHVTKILEETVVLLKIGVKSGEDLKDTVEQAINWIETAVRDLNNDNL